MSDRLQLRLISGEPTKVKKRKEIIFLNVIVYSFNYKFKKIRNVFTVFNVFNVSIWLENRRQNQTGFSLVVYCSRLQLATEAHNKKPKLKSKSY